MFSINRGEAISEDIVPPRPDFVLMSDVVYYENVRTYVRM